MSRPEKPDTFGRYRLLRILGKSSTATAWLADDAGSPIVIKLLHQHLSLDPVIRERFRRDFALSRQLAHPGIVTVFDCLAEEGRDALLMEYCPGGNLADRPAPAAAQAETWLRQILAALGQAHRQGLVHRAVKPENILIDAEGAARLSDFGSARLQNLMGLTTSTTYLAAPLYIAPEIMGGAACEPSQDLYSLGAVFYRLLSGQPHRGGSLADLLAATRESPKPLQEHRPDLPPRLSGLIDRLLAPPARRPRLAEEAMGMLDHSSGQQSEREKHCLYCNAAMPADSPCCFSCGKADLWPEEYRGEGARAIILKKIPENAEAMGRLNRFLKAWSGDQNFKRRFITEDSRMYSKAEKADSLAMPYPLINWLDPALCRELIAILEDTSEPKMRLEHEAAEKIQRKSAKKPPILPGTRPEWLRPTTTSLVLAEDRPSIGAEAGADASREDADSFYLPVLMASQRLLDRFGRADSAMLASAKNFLNCFCATLQRLQELEKNLAAVSLGSLYQAENRLRLQLEEGGNLPGPEWDRLQAELGETNAAWERYTRLESEYSRLMVLLQESRLKLNQALQKPDIVAVTDPFAQLTARLQSS